MMPLPLSIPVSPATRSDLHRVLRAGTRRDHQRVDMALARFDLENRLHYRTFLQVQSAAVFPLEQVLEESGIITLLPDWPLRSRSRALLSDLVVLGARPYPPLGIGVPDLPRQIGILYVLEGARLGAQYLLRALPPDLATVAASFLGHRGSGQAWSAFMCDMETLAERHGAAHGEILTGARDAFALFIRAAEASRA